MNCFIPSHEPLVQYSMYTVQYLFIVPMIQRRPIIPVLSSRKVSLLTYLHGHPIGPVDLPPNHNRSIVNHHRFRTALLNFKNSVDFDAFMSVGRYVIEILKTKRQN